MGVEEEVEALSQIFLCFQPSWENYNFFLMVYHLVVKPFSVAFQLDVLIISSLLIL